MVIVTMVQHTVVWITSGRGRFGGNIQNLESTPELFGSIWTTVSDALQVFDSPNGVAGLADMSIPQNGQVETKSLFRVDALLSFDDRLDG